MPLSLSTEPDPELIDALIAQMCTGPAFREVAATMLRAQLKTLYPDWDMDPNTIVVGTPSWDVKDGQVIPIGRDYAVLTDILVVQAVFALPMLYLEGQHFLAQLPIVEPAVHLPVRILDIAGVMNTLAPIMLRAYQQAQLDYWNSIENSGGSRWHSLSMILRDFWNINQVPGLTEDDCFMARQLFQTPDAATRKRETFDAPRAYVIDIDEVDAEGKANHVDDYLISVLIGKQQGAEVILTQSLFSGFKKYHSLEALGQDLPLLTVANKEQRWRLVEPEGDFFDYLACALISIQVKDIGAIDVSDLDTPDAPRNNPAQPPAPRSKRSARPLQEYVHALPDWLTSASISDQDAYARHLKDLATLHSANEGRSYDEGISSLHAYTLERLKAEMLKDHPDADARWLDGVEIVVRSPVVWGLFTVPGKIETTAFTLPELALQNLIALPLGNKSLRYHITLVLPQWFTVNYLERLISRVDVGNTYPALIKEKLLAHPQEADRRQRLYAEHLRIQLPLLALQCKIRGESAIDEQGYAYVKAVMRAEPSDRQVQGQPIVIRPLAFVPTRRADKTPDKVANMFVIGPQDPAAGPCLLYRPLLDNPLSQFPSPSNLLYALQQSVNLRESVLAWLPDTVSTDYARYVFPGDLPSPWAVVDFMVDPFKVWTMGGPVLLDQATITDDQFKTLYHANANAMVTLADRQSVSNAEARWATFKRTGWMTFNLALPFLARTVGIAAWIWQIMDELQVVVETRAHPEHDSTWTALTDLLQNIGMAITLHSASRSAPAGSVRNEPTPAPRPPAAPEPVTTSQQPTISAEALAVHDQPLIVSGAINRAPPRLATVLDSFKVSKPDTLGEAHHEAGPWQDLYRGGQHWYAPVGERWFQVTVDEGETVLIVDARNPSRTGPPLVHNSKGQWFIDTRLRLRGGSPKLMSTKARALARQKAEELRRQLEIFESQKKANQEALQNARQAMDAQPSTSTQALRQAYLQTLQTQRTEYETALQMLKEMNVHEPTAQYAPKALSYIKAQARLTQATLSEILSRFTPKWRIVHEQLQRQAVVSMERPIEDFREMRELTGALLVQLEYMHGRFRELKSLARDGAVLLDTLKSSMPVYSVDDLKAIRVSLSRNLCLPKDTLQTAPEAWSEIDNIIDTADVAIQCLRDTLEERSDRRLDERFDTLSNLVEQFQLLDERLQDFPVEYSAHAITDKLQELRGELSGFQRRAARNLGVLSAERGVLRSRPTPPSTPPRPLKQFIHTRYGGLLIGEPRLNEVGLETGLVDIRSPLTHQILATYHEKSKGVWVLHERAPSPSAEPAEVDLQLTINQGQALLDGLPAFQARARAHSNLADREPFGIEYLYHKHAQRLEKASNAIEQALTQHNITESNAMALPASEVTKAIDSALAQLYQQSNQLVQRALRSSPPTVTAVQWLKQHNTIAIKKTVNRRRIKSHTPDYLDEYTISDRVTREVLWYAHFHYSANWTPDKSMLSARLKTPAEHSLGAAADSPKGLNHQQAVAYYRSEISLQQARELFFERPKSESSR
ncbi:hypothetical protein [Pseudomonas sp. Q1]|uniref:hypothetical protein n=1 Tax=Pseudomonas sp. Q1 TaxID=2202823 RepID=UPI0013752014|nr:hypothetical protein [Pseudomonas sp. Q1]NCE84768.1 hypothetical protein [Pseudomonas sp. Q1]